MSEAVRVHGVDAAARVHKYVKSGGLGVGPRRAAFRCFNNRVPHRAALVVGKQKQELAGARVRLRRRAYLCRAR